MTPIHEQGIDAGDDKLKIPREISCAGMNDQNKGVPLVLIINNLRVSGNFETGYQEIHKTKLGPFAMGNTRLVSSTKYERLTATQSLASSCNPNGSGLDCSVPESDVRIPMWLRQGNFDVQSIAS
jgi:hypothetical protein